MNTRQILVGLAVAVAVIVAVNRIPALQTITGGKVT